MTKTATAPTRFDQTEVWVDRAGVTHRISEMSVRYKQNVIAFLERRAPRIVAHAYVDRLVRTSYGFSPCVIAEINGVAIECGATSEWAHGVWHGNGPSPGSMAELSLEQALEDEPLIPPGIDPVALIRATPLVQRLKADVDAGLGGTDGE